MEEIMKENNEVMEEVQGVGVIEECESYPRLRDAIRYSKIGRFVADHKVGVGVGFGTAVAAIGAAIAARKIDFDAALVEVDVPTDISDVMSSGE